MQINELVIDYEATRQQAPHSVNDLLDYYQKKYIAGEIDINKYRKIFSLLHLQGATSSHEYVTNPTV